MERATHVDEQGISDEEMSDIDPQEAYTAVKLVVSIPLQAAEEAKGTPKVADLKDRLIEAYPGLFSGDVDKNPPDCGKFSTAKIKLKPNPKIYRHREYQLQGERAKPMKMLLMECLEGGSPRAHLVPSFILPELNIHLKMFKTEILKLNLIHHAFIFSVILVPNLCLGACCGCRAGVCRCFCLSPQPFAQNAFSQKIRRTKNNFVVR